MKREADTLHTTPRALVDELGTELGFTLDGDCPNCFAQSLQGYWIEEGCMRTECRSCGYAWDEELETVHEPLRQKKAK